MAKNDFAFSGTVTLFDRLPRMRGRRIPTDILKEKRRIRKRDSSRTEWTISDRLAAWSGGRTEIKSLNMSMEQARALKLANRPENKIAQAKIDLEKSRLELACRNWIPDPAVTIQAQRYNHTAQAASEVDA